MTTPAPQPLTDEEVEAIRVRELERDFLKKCKEVEIYLADYKALQSRLATLERVAEAAFELWRMNRPIAWSQKEHLENPEINATSDAEKVLCRAVAEFIKEPPHAQH